MKYLELVELSMLAQLCDQYGTKLLARYVQYRRLQQLISETATLSHARRTSAPAQATLAVDPRQVRPARLPTWLRVSLCRKALVVARLFLAKIPLQCQVLKVRAVCKLHTRPLRSDLQPSSRHVCSFGTPADRGGRLCPGAD